MVSKEIIRNSLYGAIVGDALGVPFENKSRNSYRWHPLDGYVGYKTYNQPPGTWSDDSSLILATMAAIAKNDGEIVLTDIMDNFLRWRRGGRSHRMARFSMWAVLLPAPLIDMRRG